ARSQALEVDRRLLGGEVHAHEEETAVGVAELLAVEDVAAGDEEEAGDAVHDAAAVRAGGGEDVIARSTRRVRCGHGVPILIHCPAAAGLRYAARTRLGRPS